MTDFTAITQHLLVELLYIISTILFLAWTVASHKIQEITYPQNPNSKTLHNKLGFYKYKYHELISEVGLFPTSSFCEEKFRWGIVGIIVLKHLEQNGWGKTSIQVIYTLHWSEQFRWLSNKNREGQDCWL